MSNEEDLYVDGESLIAEVRKRPLLYDPGSTEYNDRSKRAKCWEEVCKQVLTNWDSLTQIEKNNLNRDIQKRWRSIRDSFLKDYKKRTMSTGCESVKGKRYIFHKQMMFIVPMIEKRRHLLGNGQPEITNDDMNSNESQPLNQADDVSFENTNEKLAVTKRPKSDNSGKDPKRNAPVEIQQQEEDEDKMFLLSLLPLFKIMKEDIKLTARIKVLEIVRQSLQTDSFASFSTYQQQPIVPANSRQNLHTQTSTEDLTNQSQQVIPFSAPDSPLCFEEIEQPTTPTALHDFKSEPESPQLLVEDRDPLSSTNEPPIPKKRPRPETVLTSRVSSSSSPEDVFDAIGKNVAHKLRGMIEQQRIIAEKIISDVMYHGQMETLTVDSHLALNKDSS